MVRYFADECVARLIVEGLMDAGCDVVTAYDLSRGKPDEDVLALAAAGGRVVVTEDWGFGELAVRLRQPAAGVIILSLYQLPAGAREQYAIERILETAAGVAGHLAIIEPGRTRLRPLPGPEQG